MEKTEIKELIYNQIFEIENLLEEESSVTKEDLGTVLSVKDGVVQIHGLKFAKAGELVEFVNNKISALVLNLEKDSVGVVVFGDDSNIREGDKVRSTGELISINGKLKELL